MISDFKNTAEDYQLEESRYFASVVRDFYRNVKGRERLELSATSAVQPFFEDAVPLVAEGIKAAIAAEKAKGSAGHKAWYPLIGHMDPMLLAVISLSRTIDGVAKRWGTARLTVMIGKAVEANLFAAAAKQAFNEQLDYGTRKWNKHDAYLEYGSWRLQ